MTAEQTAIIEKSRLINILFVVLGIVAILSSGYFGVQAGYELLNWQRVPGIILSKSFAYTTHNGTCAIYNEIVSFSVDNKVHTLEQTTDCPFIQAQTKAGDKVIILLNPQDPDSSLLKSSAEYKLVGMPLIFMFGVISLVWGAGRLYRNRKRN